METLNTGVYDSVVCLRLRATELWELHRWQECLRDGGKQARLTPPHASFLPEPRWLAPSAGSVSQQAATCFCQWARLSRYFPPATRSGQIRLLGLRLFITRCSIIHLMHDRLGQLPTRATLRLCLLSLSLSLARSKFRLRFPLSFSSSFHLFKELFQSLLPWQALPRPLAGGKGRQKGKESRSVGHRSEMCTARG